MIASRTSPSEWVFVSPMGVVSAPFSRIHARPVSSPHPLSRCDPAWTGERHTSGRGSMIVTPVRTACNPSPRMSV